MLDSMDRFARLAVLVCVFGSVVQQCSAMTGPNHGKAVVCYIGTWAVYRPGRGSFAIEHLDPSLCTHIVYAFVGLNTTADSIRSLDPWQDFTENYGKGGFDRVTSLRKKYPHLKVTLAIGGWNEGSSNYSKLVSDPARRGRFVVNAVEFVRKYNFDGLDLDWEFPAKRGGEPKDKENFVLLVKELKSAFSQFNLLLTAAFGAGKDTIDIAYDVSRLAQYLDYVHLMCYDYHGTWDGKTGANAPLTSNDVLNVEYSINYMIKLGMPASKLIMGIPLYGRTFIMNTPPLLESSEVPKLGESAGNVGFQGPFTRENGFLGYNEICMELQNKSSGWNKYWDNETQTPFLIRDNKFITYDDERSIRAKVKFAMRKDLGGAMVWSIDTDDFYGDCSKNERAGSNGSRFNDNYPLMRSINEGIVASLQEIEKENEIKRREQENEIRRKEQENESKRKDEENEIPDEDYRDNKKNGASPKSCKSFIIIGSVLMILLSLTFL